jgi:hypothetical protein
MRSLAEIEDRRHRIRQKLKAVSALRQKELQRPIHNRNVLYLVFLHRETSALEAAKCDLDWVLMESNEDSDKSQGD